MKSEKTISAQIGAVKSAIVALGDMRPGHLSLQRRANGRNPRCYAQLSYTFKKQGRTDYVQPDDVDRVKAEIENYRKFKSHFRNRQGCVFPHRVERSRFRSSYCPSEARAYLRRPCDEDRKNTGVGSEDHSCLQVAARVDCICKGADPEEQCEPTSHT